MKRFKLVVMVGLVTVFSIAAMVSAQGQSGQGKGGQSAPRLGCQERFDAMDTNHDGKLTKEEFMAAPHRGCDPEQMFTAMDGSGRGYITREEFCSGKGMGRGCMGRGMGQGQDPGTTQ